MEQPSVNSSSPSQGTGETTTTKFTCKGTKNFKVKWDTATLRKLALALLELRNTHPFLPKTEEFKRIQEMCIPLEYRKTKENATYWFAKILPVYAEVENEYLRQLKVSEKSDTSASASTSRTSDTTAISRDDLQELKTAVSDEIRKLLGHHVAVVDSQIDTLKKIIDGYLAEVRKQGTIPVVPTIPSMAAEVSPLAYKELVGSDTPITDKPKPQPSEVVKSVHTVLPACHVVLYGYVFDTFVPHCKHYRNIVPELANVGITITLTPDRVMYEIGNPEVKDGKPVPLIVVCNRKLTMTSMYETFKRTAKDNCTVVFGSTTITEKTLDDALLGIVHLLGPKAEAT